MSEDYEQLALSWIEQAVQIREERFQDFCIAKAQVYATLANTKILKGIEESLDNLAGILRDLHVVTHEGSKE